MNSKNIQDAVQNLQQFLLNEYGWDTNSSSDPSLVCTPPISQTSVLETEDLPKPTTKPHYGKYYIGNN